MTTEQNPDICPGRCNHAWEAAERHEHETGQTHQLTPNPGQPIWCADCRDTIENQLRDLPKLAARLGSGPLLTPPAETGRNIHADIHASLSPAYDLHDEATRWAHAWAVKVAARTGDPDRAGDAPPIRTSTAYLLGRLTAALSHDPDGIIFGVETSRWHRRLTNSTGTAKLTHRVNNPCPRCDRRGTIRRKDGDDLVKCNACNATWDYDHWQLLARAAINGRTKATA